MCDTSLPSKWTCWTQSVALRRTHKWSQASLVFPFCPLYARHSRIPLFDLSGLCIAPSALYPSHFSLACVSMCVCVCVVRLKETLQVVLHPSVQASVAYSVVFLCALQGLICSVRGVNPSLRERVSGVPFYLFSWQLLKRSASHRPYTFARFGR